MIGNRIKLPVVALLLSAAALSFLAVGINAEEIQSLGPLYPCAHDLRGHVWVKNEKEIFIQGFHYDGKGPLAWFHGQLRPAKGISTTDPKSYVTLPFPDGNCDQLEVGKSYKDENITIFLPRSITDFRTIGILCYQYCHNFGHVVIPEDLKVPPAPEGLLAVQECPQPKHNPCASPRNGELEPSGCRAGIREGGAFERGMMETDNNTNTNNGAAGFTFISGWPILFLFLIFETR